MGLPLTLPWQYEDGTPNYGVLLFFSSYILVLNWTLLQVIYSRPFDKRILAEGVVCGMIPSCFL
jgi:hypothetical protein